MLKTNTSAASFSSTFPPPHAPPPTENQFTIASPRCTLLPPLFPISSTRPSPPPPPLHSLLPDSPVIRRKHFPSPTPFRICPPPPPPRANRRKNELLPVPTCPSRFSSLGVKYHGEKREYKSFWLFQDAPFFPFFILRSIFFLSYIPFSSLSLSLSLPYLSRFVEFLCTNV